VESTLVVATSSPKARTIFYWMAAAAQGVGLGGFAIDLAPALTANIDTERPYQWSLRLN
jgi:hypothetical protein